MMRGTAIGTSLDKGAFPGAVPTLQNIGDGQLDAPLGFVFYDTSDGKILDYTVEMSIRLTRRCPARLSQWKRRISCMWDT